VVFHKIRTIGVALFAGTAELTLTGKIIAKIAYGTVCAMNAFIGNSANSTS
jgi:hypothetical protein